MIAAPLLNDGRLFQLVDRDSAVTRQQANGGFLLKRELGAYPLKTTPLPEGAIFAALV